MRINKPWSQVSDTGQNGSIQLELFLHYRVFPSLIIAHLCAYTPTKYQREGEGGASVCVCVCGCGCVCVCEREREREMRER